MSKESEGVGNILKHVAASPFVRALFALILIFALGVIFNADGAFYKWSTHRDMLRQTSVYGILACGMTIVIITAGIDLSVGSVLGLAAVAFSILTIHWQWSAWLAIPAVLLLGAASGATSGAVIATYKMRPRSLALTGGIAALLALVFLWLILGGGFWGSLLMAAIVGAGLMVFVRAVSTVAVQPFIATLAMMVFARGLAKYISGGKKISQYIMEGGEFHDVALPKVFEVIDSQILGGNLSVVTLIFLVCLIISWVVLARLRPGRYFFAIGGNEESARLSGVPVAWTKILAYSMSGVFAAVAGICQAAQERQGDPEAGSTYELTAIAIVVIGGTSLMGGRGSILLTLLGTLTIGYLEKILSINAVGEASRLMLTGAIIVTAVLFQRGRK